MTQPLFHPKTKRALDSYLNRRSHGLLLSGPAGVGKVFTAKWLADQANDSYYILEKPEDKSTISIEQIRELYTITRSGAPLTIIIKNSHQLGIEAQNAFLKLLEEPPENTRFILTATDPLALLETIRSRTQHIKISKPTTAELKKYIEESTATTADVTSLLATTDNKVGAIFTLLASEELLQGHQESVAEAKKFYSSSTYERYQLCQMHAYDKQWAEKLTSLLALIIEILLKYSTANQDALTRLSKQSDLLEEVTSALLTVNGNPKIHLAKLAESL